MQCNSDNSITYGEGCDAGDSTCTSCKAVMTFGGAGCYRVNDLPGMNWFIKAAGCECQPPIPVPACSDTTVPPQAEYVTFDLSSSTVDPACSGAKPGDKVADSCCSAPGGYNSLQKSFADIYESSNDSACPMIIPPPTNMYIRMQCNSDNSITYGEGCDAGDSTCTSCKAVMTFGGAGCYRVNDLPGMNWFVKAAGCECQPPIPVPACSDTTVPPQAEYVTFDLSSSTVDPACSGAKPGNKVADSCCSAPGGFNSLQKSFADVYESSNDSACPMII